MSQINKKEIYYGSLLEWGMPSSVNPESIQYQSISEWILKGQEVALSKGIQVMVSHDFHVLPHHIDMVFKAYMNLAYEGKLAIEVIEFPEFPTYDALESFLMDGHSTGEELGYFQIGPLYLSEKTLNEEIGSYMDLANRYNMPVLVEIQDEKRIEKILAILKEHVYPGNPLGLAILSNLLNSKQLKQLEEIGGKIFSMDDPLKAFPLLSSFLENNDE